MADLQDVWQDFCQDRLESHLGDVVTYVTVDGLTSKSVTVIFNEFVGAIDEKSRALVELTADATRGIAVPRRGDYFTLNSKRWYVLDIRTSEVGEHELRCERAQADV